MKNKNEQESAREYAFLLLKYRLRSVEELKSRLRNKKFSDTAINNTIDFLKERHFLDDAEFTRAWISTRLKRPYGLRRIKQELRLKGVDKEIVERQAGDLSRDYSEPDIVEEIVIRKAQSLKGLEPVKARQRLYSYLIRRGFTPEIVIEKINRLWKQAY
ncbi:MAG: regulatory protein RecX [Candidatus Omnitrophica bacterium]|nr:regulatory protein RecX [Candidatus Omnitrophota bacterium]